VAIWALVCAISPLLGSLLGMLIARIVLGVAEGPLFSLKTRFISDNFAADEIGKPNAVTALGVSLGLAVGFPLVTWLMAHVGWMGSFYAGAAEPAARRRINLALSARPVVNEQRAKPGFSQTFLSPGVRRCSAGSCWLRSPPSAICGAAAPGCRPGYAMSITSRCRPPACWRRSLSAKPGVKISRRRAAR
jgi:MFS family permease